MVTEVSHAKLAKIHIYLLYSTAIGTAVSSELGILAQLTAYIFLQNFEVVLCANLAGAGENKGFAVPDYSMAYRIIE